MPVQLRQHQEIAADLTESDLGQRPHDRGEMLAGVVFGAGEEVAVDEAEEAEATDAEDGGDAEFAPDAHL